MNAFRRPPRATSFLRWLALALLGSGAALAETKQLLTIGDLHSFNNREVWYMSIWAIVFSIVIFAAVSWALFYTVAKFRERPGEDREPAQFHGNNRLEIVLIVVPVVIVVLLTLLSVRAMARLNPTPADAVKIDVLGAQFYWNFDYPEVKVQGGTLMNGNELVLPVGKQIALTITGKDVIHAFWAPNLGGQRDAIPSVKKTWQVDTSRPGVYQGNCTVLCGASHANMRFKVIVLPQAQYDAFIKGAQAYAAPTPAAGSAEARGYQIFMQGKPATGAIACASCHRVQGTPANGQNGPDLSFFGSRNTLGAGMWEGEARLKALHEWLKHSPNVKPGSRMPAYDGQNHLLDNKVFKAGLLTDAEIDDVAAYILSLKLPADAAYWGKVPVIK